MSRTQRILDSRVVRNAFIIAMAPVVAGAKGCAANRVRPLTETHDPLRTEFNAQSGRARVVALLSPT
jgi:hypothetical protein